jgi:glyceraldehyde-3-phosphate dehydrogenase/erythrose-4-phosphate dehydrogenase
LTWRLGINEFGRIGRCVLRALSERGLLGKIQPVLINDLADAEHLVHLAHYDSTHGRSEKLFQRGQMGSYLLKSQPASQPVKFSRVGSFGCRCTLIFDATQLMVNGRLLKLLFWYNNEWGYAHRVVDLLLHWQSISNR